MTDPNDQANGGQPPVAPAAGAPDGGQSGGQGQPGGAAPQTITVDGVAYTPDQVKELAKAKADYDQLQPEFTRRSQLISDPEKLIEYGRKQWPDRFPQTPAAPVTDEEQARQQAIAQARSLGLLTKDEAEQMARKTAEDIIANREADTFIKSEAEKLKTEWDGQEGKPKFVFKDVAQYALDHNMPNLTSAFREMHWDALQQYYGSQKRKPNAPVVASPGGGTAPVTPQKKVRLDDDSFDDAFEEHFGSGK